MMLNGLPAKQGLYDPSFEHDACGIGFVANIKGKKSNTILHQALTVLRNLNHRGGQGAEPETGDGAGILIQIPHHFFKIQCRKENIILPEPKQYGVGMIFLPPEAEERANCEKIIERIVEEEGQTVLGWRTVPVDNSTLGETAKLSQPFIRQLFIGCATDQENVMNFERKLYVIRRRAENQIRRTKIKGGEYFYAASLSSRTIVYKGMLTPFQLDAFYLDLQQPEIETALALVHSRFSTNTFPSWERAHPNRYIIHNGEINTLKGNVNWMRARRSMFKSSLFGADLEKLMPIVDNEGSDSAIFDNCLEFLTLTGRSLPHAMMMMIPEPWNNDKSMGDKKRAFYEYHSCLMEPWDGPAAIAFTDGVRIGAVLDRNGLRPSRYYITKDDLIILSSEVGVLELDPEDIILKERLRPGKMLLVDTVEGRIIADEELKNSIISQCRYKEWVDKYLIPLEEIPEHLEEPENSQIPLVQRQQVFGYTFEELRKILTPMAKEGLEPLGSMGSDTPLAVLSAKPQLLYNYFKQLFAQVTNPPIDAIREEIVTAVETTIGPEGNLLDPQPENCRQIKIKSPILSTKELLKLKHLNREGFKAVTMPILYKVAEGSAGMESALNELFAAADRALERGENILILTDRGVNPEKAPIPALLALAGLHHHLIRQGTRTRAALIVESGEPREVHHFALLLGYGANAVNPYLALESIADLIERGFLPGLKYETGVKNYLKAVTKGVLKVISKMGISTMQSYRGAQVFEAVGIDETVIDTYFSWTPSRIGGIGLAEIAQESSMRHQTAFATAPGRDNSLESGGAWNWRKNGEYHLFNPETIHKLQLACRTGNYELFKEYTNLINSESEQIATLRGMLKFKQVKEPIPLEEVESVESICRRFKSGAMSFGSISKYAHETIAIAMNRIGGKSNSGEGGEHPSRYVADENGDCRCSAIKQVASGRFGVTSHYLVNAKELQIKMAQGAKPGEGGQLPGRKVYPWIAEVRNSTPGVELISPPPHHDIYSIEDLAQLIHDLKNANPEARISVKLVSEIGVGTIAAGVAKGRADVILISGYDGGTGASPRTSIRHTGLPWELGLAETHQTLILNNLRSRVVIEADGKLLTGRDVIIAALLGAEEFGFATPVLIALGCVMMRVCHLDTCPAGIATQNPALMAKFSGKPEYVINFMHFMAQNVREIMAELGFRTINEMIGRTDMLEVDEETFHWKNQGIDFSKILYQPAEAQHVGTYCQLKQDHGLDKSLDRRKILKTCQPALEKKEKVIAFSPLKNTDRVVGTVLGSEITKRYGAQGLPDDTIKLNFSGSAGQSFGAFIPKGVTLLLEGDANDYLGKGLSGGKIIVYPSSKSSFVPEENIIIGNVAFFGATGGEAYIRGIAGERFCVRNSGANVVVEGIGDHGCEYMTGGKVVVLGRTGKNFASGMSGGIAYVLDIDGNFAARCNREMVLLTTLSNLQEIDELKSMINSHVSYTNSSYAQQILASWEEYLPKFIKVIPKDYKQIIEALAAAKARGLSDKEAARVAFEENKDLF